VGWGGGDRNPPAPSQPPYFPTDFRSNPAKKTLHWYPSSYTASRVAGLHHLNADPDRILISLKCGSGSEFYFNADPDLINKKDYISPFGWNTHLSCDVGKARSATPAQPVPNPQHPPPPPGAGPRTQTLISGVRTFPSLNHHYRRNNNPFSRGPPPPARAYTAASPAAADAPALERRLCRGNT
jgi:hypothetical protein